jgi:hypothetical protein
MIAGAIAETASIGDVGSPHVTISGQTASVGNAGNARNIAASANLIGSATTPRRTLSSTDVVEQPASWSEELAQQTSLLAGQHEPLNPEASAETETIPQTSDGNTSAITLPAGRQSSLRSTEEPGPRFAMLSRRATGREALSNSASAISAPAPASAVGDTHKDAQPASKSTGSSQTHVSGQSRTQARHTAEISSALSPQIATAVSVPITPPPLLTTARTEASKTVTEASKAAAQPSAKPHSVGSLVSSSISARLDVPTAQDSLSGLNGNVPLISAAPSLASLAHSKDAQASSSRQEIADVSASPSVLPDSQASKQPSGAAVSPVAGGFRTTSAQEIQGTQNNPSIEIPTPASKAADTDAPGLAGSADRLATRQDFASPAISASLPHPSESGPATSAIESIQAQSVQAQPKSKTSTTLGLKEPSPTTGLANHASASIPATSSLPHPDLPETVATTTNGLTPAINQNSASRSTSGSAELTSSPFEAMDSAARVFAGVSTSGAAHQLRVGYQDPLLGYVELSAQAGGNGVHASLEAQSTAAREMLSGHLGTLAGWMIERHTPVESLTVATLASSSDSGSFHQGKDSTAHDNGSGAHDGNSGAGDSGNPAQGMLSDRSAAVDSNPFAASAPAAHVITGSLTPPALSGGSSFSIVV